MQAFNETYKWIILQSFIGLIKYDLLLWAFSLLLFHFIYFLGIFYKSLPISLSI